MSPHTWCGEWRAYAGEKQETEKVYGGGVGQEEKGPENADQVDRKTVDRVRVSEGKAPPDEKKEKKVKKRGWPKGKPRK